MMLLEQVCHTYIINTLAVQLNQPYSFVYHSYQYMVFSCCFHILIGVLVPLVYCLTINFRITKQFTKSYFRGIFYLRIEQLVLVNKSIPVYPMINILVIYYCSWSLYFFKFEYSYTYLYLLVNHMSYNFIMIS